VLVHTSHSGKGLSSSILTSNKDKHKRTFNNNQSHQRVQIQTVYY